MLKKTRIILSLAFLVLFTLIFIGIDGFPERISRGAAYFQLVPVIISVFGAFSAAALAGFLFLIVMTLVFGRIYCSTLCPLGTFQDFFINLKYKKKKKEKFFRYAKDHKLLRNMFTVAVFGMFVFGAGFLLIIFDPFSIFGRFVSGVIKPGIEPLVRGVESAAAGFDIYDTPHIRMHPVSVFAFLFALISAAAIGITAFYKGRLFCNTLCPAGGILALISRFSFLRIRINRDACNACGKCEVVCKASCISIKEKKVDFERCIACFNCIDSCPENGIAYSPGIMLKNSAEKAEKGEKRRGIIRAAAAGIAFLLPGRRLLAEFSEGPVPRKPTLPVMPPGAGSLEKFNNLCTACHLCASACPQNVIGVTLFGYGLSGILQPKLDFSKSYCLYDCTVCTEVCPAGALLPLNTQEKRRSQIGIVHLEKKNCISYVDGEPCTVCTEHCPVKAVYSVNYKGVLAPEIKPEICIGCGACEYVCPAVPYKAIYVDGNAVHKRAGNPDGTRRRGEWYEEEKFNRPGRGRNRGSNGDVFPF